MTLIYIRIFARPFIFFVYASRRYGKYG